MARNQDFTLNIKALFDTSDVKNKVNNLQDAFKNIKLPDNLQKSFDKTIADLVKSVNDFESKAGKGIQNKTDATGITKAIDNVIKDFTKVEDVITKIQSEINSSTDLSKIIKLDGGALQKIKQLKDEIKDLRQQIADITTSKIDEVNNKLNDIKSKGAKAGAQEAVKLFNNGEIEEAIKLLEKVKQKQEQIANPESKFSDKAKATAESNINALNSLLTTFENAQREVSTLTDQVNDKTKQLGETAQQSYNQAINKVNEEAVALNKNSEAARNNRDAIVDMANSQAQFNSEVDQLKSRIQYFFGLNNAIQLVKRTMREAYETIKELDKAMTETAVVTDFSVGDMWAQLPEYTKRANELGVTTKAAYEAATLYYQQGLKNNEVMAISNETLKMARIAGLDAAVATDRMTNAVRGFNMEINETNTQRVNDVYSRLAAISASNVDEISTAMTKVASLAHNANMEFETTAAFLAQIIETTRESAETAGTALKTVVARFSEVKELYNRDELTGADEEGEIIDVNKVSKALRTAGIDMNRYFLGEVGIDDIFMELASKWDKLTTLQQRYIATQAAGSRQQSRFIALMSDYARTQELVGEAYNANGASAKQFEITQESLESKLARLKNAWDEFAMGIANSDLVKLGVDALTGLLNVVNNLTSGFGALETGAGKFINTFAKLALLIGTLKVGKGLTAGLFGSILNTVTGGKIGGDFTQIAANAMGINPGKTLLSTLGAGATNPFKNIAASVGGKLSGIGFNAINANYAGGTALSGKLAAGVFGKLTGVGMSAGAAQGAAGLASLLPILGGIAAAAGTAYVAIKRIYDLSPSGQVKIAEKYANSLQIAADAARKTQNEFESVQEEYNRLNQNISEATTFEERTEAIKSRTEYVQSLLEQNETYAQYIEDFKVENGELLLTLDSEKLAEACDEIAKAAIKSQSIEDIGNANLAFQQYQKVSKDVETLSNQKDYLFSHNLEDQWSDDFEAKLVATTARQQTLLKQYQSYATQSALGQLGDKEISDTAQTFLVNAIGSMFDGDKVADIFEDEGTKFFGLHTSLKGTGWRTSIDEARDAYQKEISIVIPEAIKDDTKALINEVVGERARRKLEGDNSKLIDAFTALTPEYQEILADLLVNNGENIKNSDREKLYGSLDTTFSEVFQYLNQELQDQLWTSIKRIQLPVNTDIISKIYETNLNPNSEYQKIYETAHGFVTNPQYDLTEKQSGYLTNLLSNFAKDNYDSLDEFSNFLNKLFKATNSKDLDDLFNALEYLDIDSASSIEKFFKLIDDLDINFNSFGYSLDEAAKKLIELADAAKEFNVEDLREKITDNVSLMRDIKDRKSGSSGYRIFSEDEYSLLTGAGINPNQFVYSGIKNKEWTYTGEDLDSLVQALIQNLTLEIEKDSASLDQDIATGQYITNRANQKVTLDGQELDLAEALQQIVDKSNTSTSTENWERVNTEWVKAIIQELYGEQALSLKPEILIEKIQEALEKFYQLEANNETKQQIQQYATQPMDYITSINEFRPEISEQDYKTAVESKFYVDEHAEDRYDQILKSIQEIDAANTAWNKTSEQQETISRALAVNWSEEAAKLEELTEILDKNDKILANSANDSDEYSGAIHAVGEAMRAAYGEQISDDFVQAHIQQITLARESKEAYQELLDILHQDFFSNAKSGLDEFGYMLAAIQQQMIEDGLTAESLNGLEINGVAVLDDTPWMSIIEQLIKAGYDVAAFFDTLGWSVVYGPTNKDGIPSSVQLVRNQPTGYGGYQPYTGSNWGRGSTPKSGGGGGSGSKEPKREEWKSDFDWLYNLLEDITELERDQKKLQEEQNKILELGDTSTGRDLYENLIKQLANLELQRRYQSTVQNYRRREMDEFMGINSEYSKYFRFNDRDQTLEIDWDAINNIGDKKTYDKVKELVSEAEKIQDKMDDAEDSVRDVEKQIRELQNIWREEYADFEQRVLDALINSYQRIIDNYSDLHNTITDSNNDILEALEREIDLERQIRDNTQTEDEITDAEARLAFLQRDTTGGNQVDILNAQRGLDESRQAYEDTLVDQAIQRLSQDNQDAALQREKQIELMQAQLDYSVLNGEFNDDVSQLLHEAMGADGQLLTDSNLYSLLQQEESWSAMSEVDKAIWEDELNNTFKEVSAFLLKEKSEADGSFAAAIQSEIAAQGGTLDVSLQNGLYGIGMSIGSMSQAMDHVTETYDNAVSGLRDANSALANANAALAGMKAENETLKAAINSISSAQSRNSDSSAYWSRQKDLQHQVVNDLSTAGALSEKLKFKRYATGGLNTSSGPAWLDGTSSKPEYVLNALQTEAFLKLADVLPNIFNNSGTTTNNLGTNMYLDFTINVDSLSNDYDVDQLVDRVKEDIYNAASYRNVNVVNFLR